MSQVHGILHLTDLHFGAAYADDQEVILRALREDLLKMSKSALKPSVLCFTGDLVFSGTEDSFESSIEILVSIAESAGLSPEEVVLVPGNHDADARVVSANARMLPDWRTMAGQDESGNILLKDEAIKEHCESVFSAFYDLRDLFSPAVTEFEANCFVRASRVAGITFVEMNTALLTGTGLQSHEDFGKMVVPESALDQTIAKVGTEAPIVFLGHHPLDWFQKNNRVRIQSLLTKYGAAYMFGHVHDANPHQVKASASLIQLNQGGALYQGRGNDAWAGYSLSLLAPDKDHWYTKNRRWYEKRRTFDDATEISENGVFSTGAAFWNSVLAARDVAGLEDWRSSVLEPHTREHCCETMVGRDLGEIYVEPEFVSEVARRAAPGSINLTKQENTTFKQVLESHDDLVIVAGPETGKTSLLNQISLKYAAMKSNEIHWRVPARIDFGSFSPYENSLVSRIKKSLPTLPTGIKLKDLLEGGRLVILIDDFNALDKRRFRALSDVIERYSKCRFILTTSATIYGAAGMQPELAEGHTFRVLNMRPLKQRQLSALIERSSIPNGIQADEFRERLIREAESLNMPLTAVTTTFLIQIFNVDPASKPVNQANLIERYIDLLLEKYAEQQVDLGAFTYRNDVDLLSAIAEHMARTSSYMMTESDVIKFIGDYLSMFGLEASPTKLFHRYQSARILQSRQGEVCFRLRMFLEYFIAKRMREEISFREWIFDESRCVAFPNEVALYCAIDLKDSAALMEVFNRYMARYGNITSGGRAFGAKALDKYRLPAPNATAEDLDDFVIAGQTTEEIKQAREELFGNTELPDVQGQDVNRSMPDDKESDWLAHLVLLGGMIKHLELIPNDDKLLVLDQILEGWCQFILWSLSLMPDLAKHGRITINGVTYKASFPDEMEVAEIARRLAITMPMSVNRIAAVSMGTEKLLPQLRDIIHDTSTESSKAFLAYMLSGDIKVEKLVEDGEHVLERVSATEYLSRAYALKLRDSLLRYRLEDSSIDRVRKLTAEAALKSAGAKGKDLQKRKDRVLNELRRERLIVKLRGDVEE